MTHRHEMTSRERLVTAAHRKTPDRIPRIIEFERQVEAELKAKFSTEDVRRHFKVDMTFAFINPTRVKTDFSRYFDNPSATWDAWGAGRLWDSTNHYAEYLYPLERIETEAELAAYPWPDMMEPALPEFPDSIADIRRKITLPVCVGERLHSRFMLRAILEKQAADIVMPDITRCGGISEMRKMANLAETYNVPIAPHNPNGPISTIASAHTMATVPNFFRQEFMVNDVPWRDGCLSHPLPVSNGFFEMPDRPGLGFDIDESVLLAHPGIRTRPTDRAFYI